MSGAATRHLTTWSLTCGSWTRSERVPHQVVGWDLVQQTNRPSVLSIALHGPGKTPLVGEGCRLQVDDQELFSGTVTQREVQHAAGGDTAVRLVMIDHLGQAAHRQQTRRLSGSAKDIIAILVQGPVRGPAGVSYQHCYQTEQADLDLLIHLCEQSGLGAHWHEGALQLYPLAGDERAARTVRIGVEVHAATRRQDAYALPRSVSAAGWNAADCTSLRSATAAIADTHGQGERWIFGLSGTDATALQGRASQEAGRRAAAADVVDLVVDGDPAWYPGQRITLVGGEVEEHTWVCQRVVHSLHADRGYVCEIGSAPPPNAPIDRGTRLIPGIISAIDDPDGRGRVQVRYPTYGDLESPWLPAAMPGLGREQGFSAMYGLDDWVIVGVAAHDLGQGIVLGGIPAALAGDAAPRRGSRSAVHLRTPGGQRLLLDDRERSLSLRTHDGHVITLKPGTLEVSAAGDLAIQAPGRRITFTAAAIDFLQG